MAADYHNISHPSLPNYLGAASGLGYAALHRFKPDCTPSKPCRTSAPSIFGQGETWKAYQESMPSNCDLANAGEYAVRHNPPPYFTTRRDCSKFDVPYSQLATDLANQTLPAFSFITPNLINDMHDGTSLGGRRLRPAGTRPLWTAARPGQAGCGDGGRGRPCCLRRCLVCLARDACAQIAHLSV